MQQAVRGKRLENRNPTLETEFNTAKRHESYTGPRHFFLVLGTQTE